MATKKALSKEEISLGMYVELPTSWLDHSFLTSSFKVTTQDQLDKIRKLKLKEITINLEKSDLPEESLVSEPVVVEEPPSEVIESVEEVEDPRGRAPRKWTSDKLMTDDLRTVLEDKKLNPEVKAKAVYDNSVDMMDQLLTFPTAANIHASKETIYEMSKMVLHEPDTASNLLKLTSHDYYTYTHSVNVGVVSMLLAKELYHRSDAHDLEELAAGFFLHDIGKVNIDLNILNKPGKLSNFEMQHIRTHPYQGYKILKDANALSPECARIVMQHHEASDGTGYPKRLKNEAIHPYGKICQIADVFDALTSERPYKKALKPFEALRLMKYEMFSQFDQSLFSKFVKIF